MSDDPKIKAAIASWLAALTPPPRLSLSAWACENARLYSGARFRPYPYQTEILDAMADGKTEIITVKKAARVGYTQMLSAAMAYFAAVEPSKQMVVQPTIEDSEDYSKDTIDPMADWPVLRDLFADQGAKLANNTIRRKVYPGGSLKITGANSPRAFRRIDLDKIFFDEVDGYPAVAGDDGDQVILGRKRLVQSISPLTVIGSTPLLEGASRVCDWFDRGSQEYYFVPCPECGEFQKLTWGDGTGPGIRWSDNDPSTASYACALCGVLISEAHKAGMIAAGRWVAENPSAAPRHRSFHISSLYSLLPGASWSVLVEEFLDARKSPDRLKPFVNTVLGEPWRDKGEAPDWQRLYDRRETWEPGTVPAGGLFLTAGCDVQRDRLECSIWAWGKDRESWLVDHVVVMGDPFTDSPWLELDQVFARTYRHESGTDLPILALACDEGDGATSSPVRAWVRRNTARGAMSTKGASQATAPVLGTPTKVDLSWRGQKINNAVQLWSVGVNQCKAELYGYLRLDKPTDESGDAYPPGFVHLPTHVASEEFCKQLVSEHRVTRVVKGRTVAEWQQLRARNEALDCRNYARAAASRVGLDRASEREFARRAATLSASAPAPAAPVRAKQMVETKPAPTPIVPRNGVDKIKPRFVKSSLFL